MSLRHFYAVPNVNVTHSIIWVLLPHVADEHPRLLVVAQEVPPGQLHQRVARRVIRGYDIILRHVAITLILGPTQVQLVSINHATIQT